MTNDERRQQAVINDEQHTPGASWRRSGWFVPRLNRMSESGLWGNRLVIWLIAIVSAFAVYVLVTTPLDLKWQALFALGSLIVAFWIRQYEGHLVSVILILFSLISSFRYMYWRVTDTLGIGDPLVSTLDLIFTMALLGAEIYALVVLVMGYFQVLWPLKRKPTVLPPDTGEWPTVDVFIPTYNEPLDVIRPTILAASDLDWPADKINIFVLDDGAREDCRVLAEEAGIGYIARPTSEHAKAGNINYALARTNADLVAIFDADHIPTRSFLQVTVGGFLKDEDLAIVQTPHHFFSPDPFERNLNIFRKVPNEGELFYGLLQDGNDFWNASFFCGSCAVMRREALEEIGGVAVETVTEDAHSSLKMHRAGWKSAYINIPQAAGLATESLSGHVGQRIRWARGMAQIFRVDNPFLGKGLKWGQRLCYANSMLHFFYGVPRVIFLIAPLSYLFLEAHIFQAWALLIAVYVLPHLVISNVATSRMQGPYRHSFWAEAYETVLAWHIMRPTWLALINPKLGKFNVTDKGGIIEKSYIDTDIAWPFFLMLFANIIGFLVGIGRLLFWNTYEVDTVILNMVWALYNIILLGAGVAVAREARQGRRSTRVEHKLPAFLRLPDNQLLSVTTDDISLGGSSLKWRAVPGVKAGDSVQLAILPETDNETYLPAEVVTVDDKNIRLRFGDLTLAERRHLVYVMFGRADAWVGWREERDVDHPLKSAGEVIRYGFGGVKTALSFSWLRRAPRATAAVVALMVGAGLMASPEVRAQQSVGIKASANSGELERPDSQAATRRITFRQLGVGEPIRLRGTDDRFEVPFSVRTDEVINSASLTLNIAHSNALIYELSHLNILVNGELAQSLALDDDTADGAERQVELDPRLFVDYNEITFEFIAHYTLECEDDFHSSLWGLISNRSTLNINARPLNAVNDLANLPRPFFDKRDAARLQLPFVFPAEPSAGTLNAAGIVASWFGGLASYRGATFPALKGNLPPGNAVVFVNGNQAPAGVSVPEGQGARVAIQENPQGGKLLVVAGSDAESLNNAARAVTIGSPAMSGDYALIREVIQPEPRKPYDAPRWIPTDKPVEFAQILENRQRLQSEGYEPPPVSFDFATPPDLFTWRSDGVPVDLKYRYTPPYYVGNSTMNVSINDTFVRGLELSARKMEPNMLEKAVGGREMLHDEATVFLPGYELAGTSRMSFRFFFERTPTECRSSLDNMVGIIDPSSTIDLSGLSHYSRMPDLAKLANSGFPFSRLADLRQSIVALPSNPSNQAIEAYLMIMGHVGRNTGYPAIRVKTVLGADTAAMAGHDVLVLGTPETQPLLAQWSEHMPLSLESGQVSLRTLGWIDRVTSLIANRDIEAAQQHAGRVITESSGDLGAIVGFESPLSSDRDVVAVFARDESRLPELADLLQNPSRSQFVQGDVTLVSEGAVNYYRLGDIHYRGSLPLTTRIHWWFSQQPLLLLVLALGIVLVLAIVVYRALRSASRARVSAS
ncbi:MAG: cellulose synthase catalytic subunit (UDP-forming) [Salinisphaeraceae bacterium]|nr:cellulose synthase catalytic subunit (UDP-forming) [Salinisphaeraceae bacterium]